MREKKLETLNYWTCSFKRVDREAKHGHNPGNQALQISPKKYGKCDLQPRKTLKRKVDGKERHIKSAVRFFMPANNGDTGGHQPSYMILHYMSGLDIFRLVHDTSVSLSVA